MSKRIGRQTVRLAEGVVILSAASTVGPKETKSASSALWGNILTKGQRMRFLGRLHGSWQKANLWRKTWR